jgi:hypothetical protein
MRYLGIVLAAWGQAAGALAQSYSPTDDEKQQIRLRMNELGRMLEGLRGRPLVEDVEIYYKAAQWMLRFEEEFYKPEYVKFTLAGLERGLLRAKELAAGRPTWPAQKGRLSRGYRSQVDGSVQPYGVMVPDSYDGRRPLRLDVVLHGRNATLTEASFLAAHDAPGPAKDYLVLEVFGRTNNAYRWAGETDVFEALESVQKHYRVDPDRIVLRGFSMGGAGAWHIGLHHPDRWAAVEAGAGFNETRRYAKLAGLPPYQEATLHIYDAFESALNAWNVPVVGYGGDQDPQLQASRNVQEQLAREGVAPADLRALFLVGPQTAHRWRPESLAESEAFLSRMVEAGRRPSQRIRFVTYTTRYNRCFGLAVEELEKHYERAEVDIQGGEARTKNVARLTLPAGVRRVDGQAVTAVSLEKRDGSWRPASLAKSPRKTHGLQGPIDDAFREAFVCVRPRGGSAALDRFAREWAKWMRGDLPLKDEDAVTTADIENKHLVLFGDPSNNRWIARVENKLPLRWRAGYTLALIYPNPLNPKRYVVLNSGHTFGEKELRGTNALLYPRWGDWAVLRNGEVVSAGLYDEAWRQLE